MLRVPIRARPNFTSVILGATSSVFTDGRSINRVLSATTVVWLNCWEFPNWKKLLQNYGLGFTGSLGAFKSGTVDGYYIKIDNVLSTPVKFKGSNAADAYRSGSRNLLLLDQAGVQRRVSLPMPLIHGTKGRCSAFASDFPLFGGTLRSDLSGSYVKTAIIGDYTPSDLLAGKESIYPDHASRVYIESVTPRTKPIFHWIITWAAGMCVLEMCILVRLKLPPIRLQLSEAAGLRLYYRFKITSYAFTKELKGDCGC